MSRQGARREELPAGDLPVHQLQGDVEEGGIAQEIDEGAAVVLGSAGGPFEEGKKDGPEFVRKRRFSVHPKEPKRRGFAVGEGLLVEESVTSRSADGDVVRVEIGQERIEAISVRAGRWSFGWDLDRRRRRRRWRRRIAGGKKKGEGEERDHPHGALSIRKGEESDECRRHATT
jgi:hypothetical protein